MNFDAKLRRQSIDPVDLSHGHVGAMDVCARALALAEQMILNGRLEEALKAVTHADPGEGDSQKPKRRCTQ